MRKYEAMIVLDTKGKEESADQLVGNIEREFISSGAKIEQIERLGQRKFPFSPRHVESGYFVSYFIQTEPKALDSVRAKLKLNDNIYQQFYLARA